MPRNLFRILAAIASGAALVLVAPPLNQAWLHWICFLPVLWAMQAGCAERPPTGRRWYGLLPILWELREPSNRFNSVLGLLFGYASEFAIYFWLVETVQRFSNLPTPLALLVLHIFA